MFKFMKFAGIRAGVYENDLRTKRLFEQSGLSVKLFCVTGRARQNARRWLLMLII